MQQLKINKVPSHLFHFSKSLCTKVRVQRCGIIIISVSRVTVECPNYNDSKELSIDMSRITIGTDVRLFSVIFATILAGGV